MLYCGKRQKINKIISVTNKYLDLRVAGRRGRVGRLFLSNHQGCLSGKMTFKIKQRSGGMISVEETASTKDLGGGSIKLFSIIIISISIR